MTVGGDNARGGGIDGVVDRLRDNRVMLNVPTRRTRRLGGCSTAVRSIGSRAWSSAAPAALTRDREIDHLKCECSSSIRCQTASNPTNGSPWRRAARAYRSSRRRASPKSNLRRLRTERHPDVELPPPPRHAIRGRRRDPNDGNEQRSGAKRGEQPRLITAIFHSSINKLGERRHFGADNRELRAVQRQRTSEDRRVAPETLAVAPHLFADHRDRRTVTVRRRASGLAERRRDPQDVEGVPTPGPRPGPLRPRRSGSTCAVHCRHRRERGRAVAPDVEVAHRHEVSDRSTTPGRISRMPEPAPSVPEVSESSRMP